MWLRRFAVKTIPREGISPSRRFPIAWSIPCLFSKTAHSIDSKFHTWTNLDPPNNIGTAVRASYSFLFYFSIFLMTGVADVLDYRYHETFPRRLLSIPCSLACISVKWSDPEKNIKLYFVAVWCLINSKCHISVRFLLIFAEFQCCRCCYWRGLLWRTRVVAATAWSVFHVLPYENTGSLVGKL